MKRTRLFSGGVFALCAAGLLAFSGCGTVSFPDNVLEGRWKGELQVTGSLKVGDETQTSDPLSSPIEVAFDEQGIPEGEMIGQTNGSQGGLDLRELLTPGDFREGSINTSDTTGTAKLTCVEAQFGAGAMKYVFALELDLTVTKDGVQYPSTSLTTTAIEAYVVGQTCFYTTDTVTEGLAPVETPPDSGVYAVKSFTATTHGEGELSRS